MSALSLPAAILPAAALLSLSACSEAQTPAPAPASESASPQDQFWQALSTHCGNAYQGALVSNDAADADMQGADMVMHVRECSDEQISVPFHIREQGKEWDRSRTWVFTRTADGLRLKHDHRHEDGESDAVTMYGGDTADGGTATRQSFPVDAESIAMFEREGLTASVTNIWSVEVGPATAPDPEFTYQLTRTVEGGAPEPRNFRVTFDLSQPVDAPPAPWGF
ncbi:hypothetical protein GRI36_03770 [Altererythrobacter gangjinensis]|uniref:Lipoprotein n=1 Tax=Pontixanthobacter gangjinensis TaxID=1028742 RepID=A0A6I4SJZ9_9SPHN|nr:hypothetical protein [Pontixanthobacter gangjinensis]